MASRNGGDAGLTSLLDSRPVTTPLATDSDRVRKRDHLHRGTTAITTASGGRIVDRRVRGGRRKDRRIYVSRSNRCRRTKSALSPEASSKSLVLSIDPTGQVSMHCPQYRHFETS